MHVHPGFLLSVPIVALGYLTSAKCVLYEGPLFIIIYTSTDSESPLLLRVSSRAKNRAIRFGVFVKSLHELVNMYWPSVQDGVSSSVAASVAMGIAIYAAPRLYGRPALMDMKDLPRDYNSLSGSLTQPLSALLQPITEKFSCHVPLSALLQPITDKLSRHVQTAAAAFSQSKPTSAAVNRRNGEEHDNSACAR
ncbi:hypothetical protein ACOMHN_064055 [Nucella lapillus]